MHRWDRGGTLVTCSMFMGGSVKKHTQQTQTKFYQRRRISRQRTSSVPGLCAASACQPAPSAAEGSATPHGPVHPHGQSGSYAPGSAPETQTIPLNHTQKKTEYGHCTYFIRNLLTLYICTWIYVWKGCKTIQLYLLIGWARGWKVLASSTIKILANSDFFSDLTPFLTIVGGSAQHWRPSPILHNGTAAEISARRIVSHSSLHFCQM